MSDSNDTDGVGRPPNIVVILSDQHRADAWDADGSGQYATPNLRRLAERGTHFTRAWAQSPVCQPSRASLITGQYPSDHGLVRNFDGDFDSAWPTFMKSLQSVGYRTANIGKTHYLGSKELEAADGPVNAADWASDIENFGFDDVIEEFDQHVHTSPGFRSPYLDHLEERGLRDRYLEMIESVMPFTDAHWKGIASALPEGTDHTDFVTDASVSWIEDAPSDAPFFLQISYVQPHSPLISTTRWRDHYSGKVPQRWRGDPAQGSTAPWEEHLADLRRRSQTGSLTDADYLSAEESYRGMISMIDDGIGRLLQALEQRGFTGDTWIIYTSDHGEMMGEHGLMGKACFYRGAVEVPLIVCPPPAEASRVRKWDSVVQLVDVSATVVDIAGAPELAGSRGSSLRGIVNGFSPSESGSFAVSEIGSNGGDGSLFRALTDGTSRVTLDLSRDEPCEVFDLSADPREEFNLLGTRDGTRLIDELLDRARHLELEPFSGHCDRPNVRS
jgi:arylsulfatase